MPPPIEQPINVASVAPDDDAALSRWYDTFRSGSTAGLPAPLFTSLRALRTSLQRPRADRVRRPVLATDPSGGHGAMLVEYSTTDDLNLIEVEIGVPVEDRGRGLGSALWQHATVQADALGRTEVGFELELAPGATLSDSPGGRFATRAGFESRHTEDHLVLAWPPRALEIPDGSDRIVTWQGPTPPELLEAMAALRSVMEADVPMGSLTRDRRTWTPERVAENDARMDLSYRVHRALAFDAAGTPAGYTVLFVDRDEPAEAVQDDTLVASDHRGRGLGARIKAVAYAAVADREDAVERVHTWVDPDNVAMQRTNAAIGFTSAGTMHEMEARLR